MCLCWLRYQFNFPQRCLLFKSIIQCLQVYSTSCFAAFVKTFCEYCRPKVLADKCWLKNRKIWANLPVKVGKPGKSYFLEMYFGESSDNILKSLVGQKMLCSANLGQCLGDIYIGYNSPKRNFFSYNKFQSNYFFIFCLIISTNCCTSLPKWANGWMREMSSIKPSLMFDVGVYLILKANKANQF